MTHFLQAGPVRVRYESGFLRYLMFNGVEVVRMMYFAVRDQNWLTAKISITDETISQTADSFAIAYDWQTTDLGISMAGRVSILGETDGTIAIDFFGEARSHFLKNRVGLCVLHPLDGVTGQPCQIKSADGEQVAGYFPNHISPYQPFFAIQTLRWQPTSGHDLQLDFTGEVFEIEDQRNWTDASFKTYSTPLSQPFPAAMNVGDTVQHRVVFSIISTKSIHDKSENQVVDRREEGIVNRPKIGLAQRADGKPLSESEAAQLRTLSLNHLRADVFLTTSDWQSRLKNALADARLLGVSFELALFFGDSPTDELPMLLDFLANDKITIGSVLLFEAATLLTTDVLLQKIVPAVRLALPGALVGGGTDGFFADFNRNPFNYEQVDFVTYAICPQVHAFDDLTLTENLDGQTHTVRTAQYLTNGKPIYISPVTLLPRFTTVAGSATERQSPPADPRQATDFGADWTQKSLQLLARAGVASVTFYETHGPRGVINQRMATALSEFYS